VSKIAEKAVCRSVFLTCQINKNALLQTVLPQLTKERLYALTLSTFERRLIWWTMKYLSTCHKGNNYPLMTSA